MMRKRCTIRMFSPYGCESKRDEIEYRFGKPPLNQHIPEASVSTIQLCYLAIGLLLFVPGVRWAFKAPGYRGWKGRLGPYGFPTDELIFLGDVVIVRVRVSSSCSSRCRSMATTLGFLPPLVLGGERVRSLSSRRPLSSRPIWLLRPRSPDPWRTT